MEDILSIYYNSKSVHTHGVWAVLNQDKLFPITPKLSGCPD